jgi:hypothetical protein
MKVRKQGKKSGLTEKEVIGISDQFSRVADCSSLQQKRLRVPVLQMGELRLVST